MPRSVGLAHIIRPEDGPATGVWGVFTLKSAFQPIFAFEAGRLSIVAFEGLVRPSRAGVAISPASFFASVPAEDRLHVETLARTLHLLNARPLDRAASIFVNFDPSVFADGEVTDTALREMRLVLHEAGIDADRIVCEVTEQKAASPEALSSFVEALRAHDFRIAVDDYGAEESDFRRIEELRPDIVKFDAHWIVHLMDSKPGAALLRTMVETFETMGIRTLFEGIEETWQLELAERCGVAMVQGYVLAKPELAPTSFSVFRSPAPVAEAQASDRPFVAESAHAPQAMQRHSTQASFGKRGVRI